MKKTIIALLAISGVALGETYTWTNATGDKKWGTAGNWQTAGGKAATTLPSYTNENEDTYIIGNNSTVSATGCSVGNLNASLIVGDNVSLGGNWAFIFKNVTIGENFTSTFTGDGIKWVTGKGNKDQSTAPNNLSINSVYSGSLILSSIGANSTINFGTSGKIKVTANIDWGVDLAAGKNLTLSADMLLNVGDSSASLDLTTRYLLEGYNISYRDATGVDALLNYDNLILNCANGETTKFDFAKSETEAWKINGIETDVTAGSYRYIATTEGGVAVQYYNYKAIPEPTTATLSLLALAGLAARRRRR